LRFPVLSLAGNFAVQRVLSAIMRAFLLRFGRRVLTAVRYWCLSMSMKRISIPL